MYFGLYTAKQTSGNKEALRTCVMVDSKCVFFIRNARLVIQSSEPQYLQILVKRVRYPYRYP